MATMKLSDRDAQLMVCALRDQASRLRDLVKQCEAHAASYDALTLAERSAFDAPKEAVRNKDGKLTIHCAPHPNGSRRMAVMFTEQAEEIDKLVARFL